MIYDITPPVFAGMAAWPGDTPIRREILSDVHHGDATTTSALHASVHLGAHVDAPSHLSAQAAAIDQAPLDLFLGPCQVVHIDAAPRTSLLPKDLSGPVLVPRVLLATGTFPDWREFREDFAALHPDLVDFLHQKGVRLVGIDTPSVDLFAATDLPVHHACMRWSMAILEGLDLHKVPDGIYELIALPLKLAGFDGSPVRAVLRPM